MTRARRIDGNHAAIILGTFPWPDKRLSPNARLHRMAKADAVAQARSDAGWIMKEWLIQPEDVPDGEIGLHLTFYPPDLRKRDLDNLYSSFKPYQDGMCDVLQIDDARISYVILESGWKVKGGAVGVFLLELAAWDNVGLRVG